MQALYREENQAYVKNGNGNGSAEEEGLIPYDTQGVWLRIKVIILSSTSNLLILSYLLFLEFV